MTRQTALSRPTPNQMSKNGAAIRIGTVPAVIITGLMMARTRLNLALTSPATMPMAAPIATAMTTFSAV
jgi:hypothetical protein